MTIEGYLAASADPDAARANYERFVEAGGRNLEDERVSAALADIFGGSPFLAELLIRDPEQLDWLTTELQRNRAKTRPEYLVAARSAMRSSVRDLHRFQMREILRIGARDLSGRIEMRTIASEISWLADAIIETVFEYAWDELEQQYGPTSGTFAVIGMGKLGAEELNFSSDVDLIYICSDDMPAEPATRLARRITQILTEPTSDGTFYRVDLRLRPEGSRGAVVSPIQVLQTYYDSWGETFERFALIKARPVAGRGEVGDRFIELIQPFVYRKYLDYAAVDEVRDIKERINQQIEKSAGLERNLKLGRGGIREAEFFVQALQILYGGEILPIRVRGTLEAIDTLEDADIVEPAIAGRLREAYIFLRNLEHKLQIVHQLQTHEIPEGAEELRKCARRMHMPLAEFQSSLDEHRAAVHDAFHDLFGGKSITETGVAAAVHRFLNLNMDRQTAHDWLTSLNFKDPVQSLHNLELLRDAPAFGRSPARMRNQLSNVLTPLMETAGGLIRPDVVINAFERIVAGVGAREAFFTSLLENPKSIFRLVRLLALSDYLSDILFDSPEAIGFIIDDERLNRRLRNPFPTHDRRLQEFYIGAQYLFGITSRRRANRILTAFAERELRKSLPGNAAVAIFAAGKFGEREMNFRSDLDVIAFYEGDYNAAVETVEAMVHGLAGRFKLDLRLRPEGTKGALVWSPERYREYVRDRGETWERMALTKARFVAGDQTLAEKITPIIHSFVYGQPFGQQHIEEMNLIRARMENELGRETKMAWDVKLGRGGIVDIEFLVEYRQIQQNVRIPNTVLVMKRLGPALLEEYEFLRNVESMLRLWSPLAGTRIEAKDVEALGLMLHLRDFAGEYKRVTEEVRRIFQKDGDNSGTDV